VFFLWQTFSTEAEPLVTKSASTQPMSHLKFDGKRRWNSFRNHQIWTKPQHDSSTATASCAASSRCRETLGSAQARRQRLRRSRYAQRCDWSRYFTTRKIRTSEQKSNSLRCNRFLFSYNLHKNRRILGVQEKTESRKTKLLERSLDEVI